MIRDHSIPWENVEIYAIVSGGDRDMSERGSTLTIHVARVSASTLDGTAQ